MITFTIQALKDRWARVRANPKFQKLEEVAVRVFGFIILRLQEASTWRGITLALSAVGGYSFGDTPDKALAFVGIGMFLAGLVGMVFPDAVKKAEQVDHSQSSFGQGIDPTKGALFFGTLTQPFVCTKHQKRIIGNHRFC